MIGLFGLALLAPKLLAAFVAFAMLAIIWLLQTTAFAMPAWLVGLLPVVNFGLNEVIIRLTPTMSGADKRNLVRAVSITIVVGLAVFRVVTAPTPPTGSTLLEDWAPYAILLLGWIWAGAIVVHDGIDGAGKRLGGQQAPAAGAGPQ